MIKPISKNRKLFCEQYWERVMKNSKPNTNYKSRVSTSFDIYDVNTYFINANPNYKKNIENEIGMPIRKFLYRTDKEFKQLTPTTEDITVWRGISPPSRNYKKRNAMFEQASNCKPGDTICMHGYAYASEYINTAMSFAENGVVRNGILYEIQIPKGSRVHRSTEFIFPRYSKMECIGKQELIKDGIKFNHIKLKYIQPKEIKLNVFEHFFN